MTELAVTTDTAGDGPGAEAGAATEGPELPDALEVIERHLAAGRFNEVLSCCQALLRAGGRDGDPDVYTKLGIAHAELGQVTLAVEAFRKSVELDPARASCWRNLGVALGQSGRHDEAAEAHRRAVALEPANPVLLRLSGEAERAAGRAERARAALESALAIEGGAADRESCLRYVDLLNDAGRPSEAADFLYAMIAHGQRTAHLWDAVGLGRLHAGDLGSAAAAFEEALRLDPRDVDSHLDLAVCHARGGKWARAVGEYEQGLLLHRVGPRRWQPSLPREVAQIGLLHERGPDAAAPDGAYHPPRPLLPGAQKLLTVLVGCYGDFPRYSLRALDSVVRGADLRLHCDVLVGLNACCPETTRHARRLADEGLVDSVVECRPNINKDPMMRVLLEMVRTPYVLWMDDDSHFVDPEWPSKVAGAVAAEHPFDVAGQLGRWGPRRFDDPAYAAFAGRRPWFCGDFAYSADLREWIPFAPGGLFAARTDYLRQHDYPDRGMTKAADDVLLGELVQQRGGRLVALPAEVLRLARVNDGERRGENFVLPDAR